MGSSKLSSCSLRMESTAAGRTALDGNLRNTNSELQVGTWGRRYRDPDQNRQSLLNSQPAKHLCVLTAFSSLGETH